MWFAFRMSGFGGQYVPVKMRPTVQQNWYAEPCEGGVSFRNDPHDGFACDDEESCDRWCDFMNRKRVTA